MNRKRWHIVAMALVIYAGATIDVKNIEATKSGNLDIVREVKDVIKREKIRNASILPALPEPEESYEKRKKQYEEDIRKAKAETELEKQARIQEISDDWEETFPIVEGSSPESDFLNEIAKDSVQVAREHGLYPSILMAQAGLESNWGRSGLAANHNNLFGIKGHYNGSSANYKTWEDLGSNITYINAGFRSYPTIEESIRDYAFLLKNGLRWDESFYSGAWRENAETYDIATEYLQGRYATDTQYANKLNRLIERFELTRFDAVPELDLNVEVAIKMPKAFHLKENEYLVQEGDTIQLIALKNQLSPEEFFANNKLSDYRIYVNQIVSIAAKDKRDILELKGLRPLSLSDVNRYNGLQKHARSNNTY